MPEFLINGLQESELIISQFIQTIWLVLNFGIVVFINSRYCQQHAYEVCLITYNWLNENKNYCLEQYYNYVEFQKKDTV